LRFLVEEFGAGHFDGPVAQEEVLNDVLGGDFGGLFVDLREYEVADHG
jgi:hypothetical protein